MARIIAKSKLDARSIDILNVIRNNASYAYQKDVPEITQEQDIPKVGEILFGNPTHSNEFINALVNRIALVRVQSATFNNPYKHLKKGYLEFGETVEVKQFGGESQMKITTKYKIEDNSTEVDNEVEMKLYNALKGHFAKDMTFDEFTSTQDNPNGIISSDKVGPTIANDMKGDAMIAVVLSLLAIFLYIAVRFSKWTWGAGALISLTHNAIIVIGFFSLFSGILPFSLDVDQTFIAAVLTIIGYSINDTVVIFDRIREFKRRYKRDFTTNVNSALNSTLSRTITTSGTTLVVLIAIALFGGEVIRGFAVALIIGVVVGTYSSIFIATPTMYDMSRKIEEKSSC